MKLLYSPMSTCFLIQINKQFCQMLEAQDMLAAPTMRVCRQLLLGLLRTADEWRDIPVSMYLLFSSVVAFTASFFFSFFFFL